MAHGGRLPLLALVRESATGEDPDFGERFRVDRLRRLGRGLRNGMGLASLIRYRIGGTDVLRLRGVPVRVSDKQVTCRLIEDIWMRGEYDIPGFVPRPGWRVVDIGANVGIFAMLAASRGARVVCYEPHPESFRRLREHTAKWPVECHPAAAVGRAQPTVSLYVHARHTRNTVTPPSAQRRPEYGPTVLDVPAVSVEEILAQPCDLLKVDCEGGEFELFANAGPALRNAHRIIAELHGAEGNVADLVRAVRAGGFEVTLHDPYPGLSFQLMTAVRR
jgi:FkbM family methyltransferase